MSKTNGRTAYRDITHGHLGPYCRYSTWTDKPASKARGSVTL